MFSSFNHTLLLNMDKRQLDFAFAAFRKSMEELVLEPTDGV
jgi:hypothetical protein